jgi:hypothetical protein
MYHYSKTEIPFPALSLPINTPACNLCGVNVQEKKRKRRKVGFGAKNLKGKSYD